jgi:hypothetical protein
MSPTRDPHHSLNPGGLSARPLALRGLRPAGALLEVHHVVKRAQGGSDFEIDRLVALCPPGHAQADAPYARGRLVVILLGAGRFTVKVTRGADKWAIRSALTAVDAVLLDLPTQIREALPSSPPSTCT